MSAELDLLRALRDCEQSAQAGAPADRAVLGAVLRFGVEPAELRRVWLQKTIACQRARSTLAADEE